MKKTFLILICLLMAMSVYSKKASKTINVPKNVKIVSQSCTMYEMFQTVIDLDNNEVVVITYYNTHGINNNRIVSVLRTGMFVDPGKQISFLGIDAPFDDDDDN